MAKGADRIEMYPVRQRWFQLHISLTLLILPPFVCPNSADGTSFCRVQDSSLCLSMLRLLPDILTNASNQDPTIGTGEKDQTSRTSFWIWVAGSRSGSERRLHGALLLLASGDGQHFRATFAASQCMNQPVQSRETRTCMNHCTPIMICLPQDKSMSKFYFSRISLAPQAVHRRSFEYASEGYGG